MAKETATQPRHAELGLTDDDVRAMYRQMLLARAVDERMWLMQRAGKIAFIISGQGHEGAQVGTAWPLRRGRTGWRRTTGPSPRRSRSACRPRTSSPPTSPRATTSAPAAARCPATTERRRYNIVSLSLAGGTQVLHAVGIAMGAWVKGDDVVALTSFGEGTSNQGEIHEAMNFAGVHKLPVIFVCENNGYAISVPLDKQVGGGTVAARAEGYGLPGVDRRRDRCAGAATAPPRRRTTAPRAARVRPSSRPTWCA